METVTARVPEELFRDIVEIERQEKAERAEVIRKLLDRAVREWKLKRSLEMLREGKTTFRTAAKMAGLTYVEMLDEVERAGIPIRYSMAELQADLSELKKRK
jgi:predicted HTH domain antitoxin